MRRARRIALVALNVDHSLDVTYTCMLKFVTVSRARRARVELEGKDGYGPRAPTSQPQTSLWAQDAPPSRRFAGPTLWCTAVHRTRRSSTTAVCVVRRCGNFVSRELHFRKRGPTDWHFQALRSATPCRPDPRCKETQGSLSISPVFNRLAVYGHFSLHQRSGDIWDLKLGPV